MGGTNHGHMLIISSIVVRGCRRSIERSLPVITRHGVRPGTRPRILNDRQIKRKVKWRTSKSQADSKYSVSRRSGGSRSRILTLKAASEDGRNYIERLFSFQLSQKRRIIKIQNKRNSYVNISRQ